MLKVIEELLYKFFLSARDVNFDIFFFSEYIFFIDEALSILSSNYKLVPFGVSSSIIFMFKFFFFFLIEITTSYQLKLLQYLIEYSSTF